MIGFFQFKCVHDLIVAIKNIRFHTESSQGNPNSLLYNYFLTTNNKLISFTLIKDSSDLTKVRLIKLVFREQSFQDELGLYLSTIESKCKVIIDPLDHVYH